MSNYKLVENKKGNVGYVVKAYNFIGEQGGVNTNKISGSIERCGSIVSFRSVKVQIHSCGKKEMKLKPLKTDFLSGHLIFNPKKYIFSDIESAEEYALDQYNNLSGIKGKIFKIIQE